MHKWVKSFPCPTSREQYHCCSAVTGPSPHPPTGADSSAAARDVHSAHRLLHCPQEQHRSTQTFPCHPSWTLPGKFLLLCSAAYKHWHHFTSEICSAHSATPEHCEGVTSPLHTPCSTVLQLWKCSLGNQTTHTCTPTVFCGFVLGALPSPCPCSLWPYNHSVNNSSECFTLGSSIPLQLSFSTS